jgi:serine/threonine protein kinase
MERQLERARSEIETLKLCQHPNIMRLYEVYENCNHIYLVLEYLGGGNLQSYLRERRYVIRENAARRVVYAVACALNYLHAYGIVHRDIKAENIVLAQIGSLRELKLVDFGFAKVLGPGQLCTDPVGTLTYAAPEILLGHNYGLEVDLWSLGVLAHLLLVGRLPFDQIADQQQVIKYFLVINLVGRSPPARSTTPTKDGAESPRLPNTS